MPRLLRASVAIAVALVTAAPLAPAHARGGAPIGDDLAACPTVTIKDGWARIKSPTYPSSDGDSVVAASAVPAGRKGRVYVTNGSAVRMSDNAGCKWEYIYPPTSGGVRTPKVGKTVFTHLVAPSNDALWIAGYDTDGPPRPHVLRTLDATYSAGNTTEQPIEPADDGLPAVGKPVDLVADGSGERAFLLLDEPHDVEGRNPLAGVRSLYRLSSLNDLEPVTGQKRLSWERVTLPQGFAHVDGMTKPKRTTHGLYIWSGRRFAWTADAGLTWSTGTANGVITAIDVNFLMSVAVFSKQADGGLMEVFNNRHQLVGRTATPIAVSHVAHGLYAGTYAIIGQKRVFGFDTLTRTWIDITPKGAPAFADLHMGASALGRILLAQAPAELWRFDLFPMESFVKRKPGGRIDINWGEVPDSDLAGVTLTPERQVVTVRPGERKPAPVTLRVPPAPSPIDVFFLIDTTASMTAAIRGLKDGVRNIASDVQTRTRGQACFGLGEIKDFSLADNPWYGDMALTPYKLHQPISCEVDDLAKSLERLREGGGDRFPEESQALALQQAVKGTGHIDPPVTPGQDAKFRAPTRVIVLITDTGFKLAPQHRGYPTMEETIRDLNAFRTHVVGIALQTANDIGPAIADLTAVAKGTNTLAAPDGVDCDSDGSRDVEAGEPIVCPAENYAPAIAPAIVGVLLGVKEPASIGVSARDPHSVLVEMAPSNPVAQARTTKLAKVTSVQTVVNVRVETKLDVKPVVTCSKAQDGLDLPVLLTGLVRQVGKAEAEILVRCRAKPVEPIPPPPPPIPPVIDPVFVLPKPQPAPVIVPQFQPPPPNNPPGNLNMNAGLSQEEEQQFQLAGVTQNASEADQDAEDVELAMSGLGDGDAAAATMLFGCAIGVSIAAGGVLAQRRRTQRSLRTALVRARF